MDKGAEAPEKTGGGPKGRDYEPKGGGSVTSTHYTSHQGSVVIRATVDHIGVAGDTEMTVTVKWPASSFCAPSSQTTSPPEEQESDVISAPENGPGAYILHAIKASTSKSSDTTTEGHETLPLISGTESTRSNPERKPEIAPELPALDQL